MFGVGDWLLVLTVLWCGKLEASVSSWSKSRLLVRFCVEKPSWWEPSTHLRSFNDNYPTDGKHKPTISCNSSRSFRSSTIFYVVLLHIPTQATGGSFPSSSAQHSCCCCWVRTPKSHSWRRITTAPRPRRSSASSNTRRGGSKAGDALGQRVN
jgi:hypothetical protein